MTHSYLASSPSTALSSYVRFPAGEFHANSSPLVQTVSGVDYHGDIRAAVDRPTGFLSFQSMPECGIAVSMADYFGPSSPGQILPGRADSLLAGLACYDPLHPAAAIHSVNRAICGLAGDDSHLSLFHAWVDPYRRELRYVNAGHEPALLFRKRRERIAQLEHTGTVLGLTVRSNYCHRSIPMEPGDVLVVFTAGLIETTNIDGSMFGSRGVIDVVRRLSNAAAASIVSTALDEAARHAGWALRSSDHGIAVVRLVGERELIKPLKAEVEEPAAELALAAA